MKYFIATTLLICYSAKLSGSELEQKRESATTKTYTISSAQNSEWDQSQDQLLAPLLNCAIYELERNSYPSEWIPAALASLWSAERYDKLVTQKEEYLRYEWSKHIVAVKRTMLNPTGHNSDSDDDEKKPQEYYEQQSRIEDQRFRSLVGTFDAESAAEPLWSERVGQGRLAKLPIHLIAHTLSFLEPKTMGAYFPKLLALRTKCMDIRTYPLDLGEQPRISSELAWNTNVHLRIALAFNNPALNRRPSDAFTATTRRLQPSIESALCGYELLEMLHPNVTSYTPPSLRTHGDCMVGIAENSTLHVKLPRSGGLCATQDKLWEICALGPRPTSGAPYTFLAREIEGGSGRRFRGKVVLRDSDNHELFSLPDTNTIALVPLDAHRAGFMAWNKATNTYGRYDINAKEWIPLESFSHVSTIGTVKLSATAHHTFGVCQRNGDAERLAVFDRRFGLPYKIFNLPPNPAAALRNFGLKWSDSGQLEQLAIFAEGRANTYDVVDNLSPEGQRAAQMSGLARILTAVHQDGVGQPCDCPIL